MWNEFLAMHGYLEGIWNFEVEYGFKVSRTVKYCLKFLSGSCVGLMWQLQSKIAFIVQLYYNIYCCAPVSSSKVLAASYT